MYGVGKPGPLRFTAKYVCPTADGAEDPSIGGVPYVECNPQDQNQYWTINDDGTVTDATGACLTMGKKAPSAPVRPLCAPHQRDYGAHRYHS